MENYVGTVQNVVMIKDDEYRVTFRAYNETDAEECLSGKDEVPFTVYSMIARRQDEGYKYIAEGRLRDCITVFRDNSSVETVPTDDLNKWKIGIIADNILSSLADTGMFTPWTMEEEDEEQDDEGFTPWWAL